MNVPAIVAILVALLALVLLGVIFVVKRTGREPITPDYRALFIMGTVWLPVGVAIGNPGFWGVGVVFLVIGLANRDKWRERKAWADLSHMERRMRVALLVGLGVLLLVGVAFFLLRASAS